ncbi:hypothetical protein MMC17_002910 [Xylographa soralifera]|nr:hypothetical protein [Xylographa soralifera]
MNTPANYRNILARLSKETGIRCVTVHQRLAPQNPFPAALLDIFYAYVSLLAPPPGSSHDAVSSSSIIIAGDSSGACLTMCLLQVLLTLKRRDLANAVGWHGSRVDLELPAGLTLLSAVGEIANSLPSYKSNMPHDVFPENIPAVQPGFPTCRLWPSKPPRGNIYCNVSMLHHPIVSPAASWDWTGSPPMWFASGEEQIIDGAKVVAQTAFQQNVNVVFQEYEAMPYTFMWQYPDSSQSKKCWND